MTVRCEDCRHFLTAPYQVPHTGCWYPDHMKVKQKDAYLHQQQLPGDHAKINLRRDCAQFEQREKALSLLQRIRRALAS